ncbi:MAG: sialidase family protein, partial [Thermoplasmatota archaeon]
MTWKLLLVTLPLLAVGLAGCLGDDDADDVDAGPEGAGAQAAYVLDCSIGGNGWAEPCLAWASPNESPSKTEIDLVVNPTDPLNVVVASKDLDRAATNDCVWSVAQVTYDGGHTWNTSYVGGTIADRQPGDPLYGWDCVTDPIMTFNRDGDLFYNLQAYRLDGEPPNPAGLPGPDAAMMGLFISRDGGTTWPDFVLQQPGDDLTVFPDYMHMGTNPATGSVFTAWNNIVGLATSTPTVAAYRGDPLPIATLHPLVTPDSPTGTGESSIVGANDGTVYAWLGGFNSPDVAYYSISTDDGLTWSLPAEAFPFTPMAGLQGVEFRDGTAIELAVDNSGGERDGCLYAAWGGQEAGVAGGTVDGSDIYVRRS